jgi:ribosomal protein S18 acetylase RimI-like enzyme
MREIYMVAVDPDFQGRGIGSALIEFAPCWMKEAGMSVAMVETGGDPGHERARHTYEKAGFELWLVARYFKKLACTIEVSKFAWFSLGDRTRSIESCLVSPYLMIHKQGLDKPNPTYSEGRSLVPILRLSMIRLGSASSKRQSRIGAVIVTLG